MPMPPDPTDATGPMRLVLTTLPDAESARALAEELVRRRLAACVQELPIRSTYRWKGEVEVAEERLLLLKTGPKQVGALFEAIRARHPYEVPEIVEIDVGRVAPSYLAWLLGSTGREASGDGPLRVSDRGSRRARAARRPGGSRGPHRRRSRHTGRR